MNNFEFLNTPRFLDNTVHVVGLADHEDGDAYEVAAFLVELPEAFVTALHLLSDRSDHVLIVSDEDYTSHPHTFMALAPYSIHITKGIEA